jgi:SAM-dependent methyltransferase
MHYDENYFRRQKEIGQIGGQAELFKFRQFVSPDDTVLDFGCGGGFVLRNLDCRRRLGVDINPSAREHAKSQGVEVFESVEQLPEQVIDVVISNHALEHVPSPCEVLIALRRKLKSTSLVVFVVPHDCTGQTWQANDINMHLYTWNRMTLGNLFVSAGYAVERVDAIRHCRLFCHNRILGFVGQKWCHRLGYLEAWLRGRSQVIIVARPGNGANAMKAK